MKTATPVHLWAVVVGNPRTEWIHYYTIRRTKREAWKALLELHDREYWPKLEAQRKRGGYRVARVVVALEKVE